MIVKDIATSDFPFLHSTVLKNQDIISVFKEKVQQIMDERAKASGYDDIISATSYAGFPNKFQKEGIAFGQWRAKVWDWGYGLLAKYKDTDPSKIPSLEAMFATMPLYEEPELSSEEIKTETQTTMAINKAKMARLARESEES